MENPASWNLYQKSIAFYSSDVPPGVEENIVIGLIAEKYLNIEHKTRALAVVKTARKECKRLRAAHIVGLSDVTIIYYALREAELLP